MEIIVDDVNYKEEVLQSELPVLVDFWAAWCMPCLAIAPTVAQLAKEYKGRIKVCKINVDDAQKVSMTYKISSIPCIVFFKDGEEVDRIIGSISEDLLNEKISDYLRL